jgi:hypothetical protein
LGWFEFNEPPKHIEQVDQLGCIFGKPMVRLNVPKGRWGPAVADNRPFPMCFPVAKPVHEYLLTRNPVDPHSRFNGIEPYGEAGKYKLIFSEKAKAIEPIPFADATPGAMQGPRYTTLAQLKAAKKLTDLTGKT